MGKRKREPPRRKRKGRAAAVEARPRPAARRGPTTRKQPAKKKVAAKAHARKPAKKRRVPAKRVDWTRKAAPAKGSKQRAAYEASATYRKRKRAAAKAKETRRKREEREQARLRREERVAVAKERLGPLLAKLASDYKWRRYFSDTRESHANWYGAKVGFGSVMRRRDFERVLEELSLEHDLDELGWDIVY